MLVKRDRMLHNTINSEDWGHGVGLTVRDDTGLTWVFCFFYPGTGAAVQIHISVG